MGRLMRYTPYDEDTSTVVGVDALLGNALNISLDASSILSERVAAFSVAQCSKEKSKLLANMWPLSLSIFAGVLKWYHEAVYCAVTTKNELPWLLSYMALPSASAIDSLVHFSDMYNLELEHVAHSPRDQLAKVETEASKCVPFSLSKGTPLGWGFMQRTKGLVFNCNCNIKHGCLMTTNDLPLCSPLAIFR